MTRSGAGAARVPEELLGRIGGFERFTGEAVAAFVLSDDGACLAANALGLALLEQDVPEAARARMLLLATRLAPFSGVRIERLELVAGAGPVSVACRRLRGWPDGLAQLMLAGEPALLGMATLDDALRARLAPPAAEAGADAPALHDAEEPEAAVDPAQAPIGMPVPQADPDPDTVVPARMPQRFTWETAPDGTLRALSAEASAIFGASRAAGMIGARWETIAPGLEAADPAGWRGLEVLVPVGDGRSARRVALSGAPVRGAGTGGARGFGLLRGDPVPMPVRELDPEGDREGDPERNPAGAAQAAVEVGADVVMDGAGADPSPFTLSEPGIEAPASRDEPNENSGVAITDGATEDGAIETGIVTEASLDEASTVESASLEAATAELSSIATTLEQATIDEPASPDASDAQRATAAPDADPAPGETDQGAMAPVSGEAGSSAGSGLLSPAEAPLADTAPEPAPAVEPVTPEDASTRPDPASEPVAPLAPAGAADDGQKPALSHAERNAFREIARALGARLEEEAGATHPGRSTSAEHAPEAPGERPAVSSVMPSNVTPFVVPQALPPEPPPGVAPPPALRLVSEGAGRPGAEGADRAGQASLVAALAEAQRQVQMQAGLLDKLPIGALVMREGRPLYANRTLLDLLGHADLAALAARAPDRLFAHRDAPRGAGGVFSLLRADGAPESVDARMSAITWNGEPATLMAFRRAAETADHARIDALELDLQRRDRSLAELASVLDIATDGVVTVDGLGRILSLNRTAEALFGYDQREVTGEHFTTLMAPESHVTALDYLDGLKGSGVAALMNDGREVQGRVRQGGRIPLFVTMGRIADGPEPRFCAVLRDMTAWKQAESELTEARRAAEAASAQKSDVLAKISHEIRTPLNAIIGFAEVMAEERFGPVGNERYRGYLKDIHESGGYVISLVNDLLDLAKIEAGKVDFNFTAVSLNDIATASVSLLQSEAQRQRVVLRSGLQPKLPQVVADERSIRQIVLNILSNAVKFTDAGGQVIVSTALSDRGEAILRVRDTGIGMTDKELASAMEPFRQVSNTRRGQGTGLGLPITRALVEANKGTLVMTSVKGEGTLVEVSFPPQRVLAS